MEEVIGSNPICSTKKNTDSFTDGIFCLGLYPIKYEVSNRLGAPVNIPCAAY